MKTINQSNVIAEIGTVAGINKANATNVLNFVSRLWNQDPAGLIKAIQTGVKVTRTPAKRPSAKKVATRKAATTTTSAKKTKKKVVAKKSTSPVATVKTKNRKVKKNKKLKAKVIPTTAKASSSSKTV